MINARFINEIHDLRIEININDFGIAFVLSRADVNELLQFIKEEDREFQNIGNYHNINIWWNKDVDKDGNKMIFIGLGVGDGPESCDFGITLKNEEMDELFAKIKEFAW